MDLVGLLIFIVVIGVLVYIVTLLPIPELFKKIAYVVAGAIVIIWLLRNFAGMLIR